MKTYLVFASTLCGISIAMAGMAAAVKWRPFTRPGQEEEYKKILESRQPTNGKFPHAVYSEKEFDFGTMYPNSSGEKEFEITNQGSSRLVLNIASKSCTCVEPDISKLVLEPGEVSKLTLAWSTAGVAELFRQWVAIQTNDPQCSEIIFAVIGKVKAPISISASTISVGGITPGEKGQAIVEVTSSELATFKLGVSVSDPNLSFVVRPFGNTELTSRRVKSGYFVEFCADSANPPVFPAVATLKPSKEDGSSIEDCPDNFEVGVLGRFTRQLALYGKWLINAEHIDLGRAKVDEPKTWKLIAKLKGAEHELNPRVSLRGLDGFSAEFRKSTTNTNSGEIAISYDGKGKSNVYSLDRSGTIEIVDDRLGENERISLPIKVVVD